MKLLKKTLCAVLAVLLSAGLLCGCGEQEQEQKTSTDNLSVVCTIFPEYDWIMQILGDQAANADVTMLLDRGVDLHNYQPTADDIIKISTCDVFVYVGGASDTWADDALANATNKEMKVVCLMDALGNAVKEETVVEGMEAELEDEEADEGGPEYDEHVWLSLKNAKTLCGAISDVLGDADSDHAADYQKNTEAYTEKLTALDADYQSAVDAAQQKTLLFGDRFPFRYMTDDYNLTYYAAFVGCSAETEASFDTIVFLAGKLDELQLDTVLTIEGSDEKLAKTIIQTTKEKNQKILSLNSMQATTAADVEKGTHYLDIMQKNLTVLKTALGVS